MKQIRNGVFETNSSSTHSICIAKKPILTIPNLVSFAFETFGWEERVLNSIKSKANYLYTALIQNKRTEDAENIFNTLKNKNIGVLVERPIYEKRSYKDGGKLIEYTEWVNACYVDHGCNLEKFLNAICENEDELMDYLFSPLSFIITGNDNQGSDVSINVDYLHNTYYKGN